MAEPGTRSIFEGEVVIRGGSAGHVVCVCVCVKIVLKWMSTKFLLNSCPPEEEE